MRIGIMQPYFLPYIGYFSLIKNTDKWIVFDKIQYINKGWINRNRILKQGGIETNYITVPLKKASLQTLIKDMEIDESKKWREKIKGQFCIYKKAPYYKIGMEILDKIFAYETKYISELNVYAMKVICEYLDINFDYEIFSEKKEIDVSDVKKPDEWALKISSYYEAEEYINPPGGKSFFNSKKYLENGIRLKFLTPILKEYKTFSPEFIQGLSIIDVILWNSKEEIQLMLDNFILEE